MTNKYGFKAKLVKNIFSKIQQNKKREQYLKYFKFPLVAELGINATLFSVKLYICIVNNVVIHIISTAIK